MGIAGRTLGYYVHLSLGEQTTSASGSMLAASLGRSGSAGEHHGLAEVLGETPPIPSLSGYFETQTIVTRIAFENRRLSDRGEPGLLVVLFESYSRDTNNSSPSRLTLRSKS